MRVYLLNGSVFESDIRPGRLYALYQDVLNELVEGVVRVKGTNACWNVRQIDPVKTFEFVPG